MVRPANEGWEVAVIEPTGDPSSDTDSDKKGQKKSHKKEVLALPKGLIDPGEKPAETAVREVHEETGISARIITKLSDIKYVYVRSWGDRQRVFKIVSFYLLSYESGTIDAISPNMRIEVKQARWIPLAEAEKRLAYRGERDVVKLAQEYLNSHSQEAKG